MADMTIVVKVRPEKRHEFLQVMRSLDHERETREGLRSFTLSEEATDPTSFSLNYEWETQGDLDQYLGAEKFSVLMGALRVLCEQSDIRRKRG